jgi:hypothetical protein
LASYTIPHGLSLDRLAGGQNLGNVLGYETPVFDPIDEALFESRIVQISGPVDSNMAKSVNRTLLAMDKKDSKKKIFLFINSPGGEITSGFSIYDTARFIGPEVVSGRNGTLPPASEIFRSPCAQRSPTVTHFQTANF